jgi:AGZA family xanthine/uracil permease-like MFS transporter
MGQNAFVAYTVVGVLGYPWQTAVGAIFIGGSLFTLLSLFRARELLAESIPESLKRSFAVGIGLFLAFIGLSTMGVVAPGTGDVPVRAGDLSEPAAQLAVAGFALMVALHLLKVPGSILLAILATAGGAVVLGLAPRPEAFVGAPPDLGPTFLALDIPAALTWGFASVILTIFVLDLVDTIGTLIGLGYKAGLVDEEGRMPGMERALQCDAVATVVASLLGTTTAGAYIESATGIEAGGRTGRTAIVTALWFLAALFFAPLFSSVPPAAYGPALVMVGMLMLEPVRGLPFDDLAELLPAFLTITLMSFTYDLGIGITAGLASHVLLKLVTGRAREVRTGMWILGGLSVLFYVFYPY